jgi:hypothetical protein
MGTFLTVVVESAAASFPKLPSAQAYQASRKLPLNVEAQPQTARATG